MNSILSKIAIAFPVLAAIISLEIIQSRPDLFWPILGVILGLTLISALYLSGFLKQKKLAGLFYLILPFFYIASAISVFVLAQKSYIAHFFILSAASVLGLALYNIKTLSKYRFESGQEVILKSQEDKRKHIALTINQALVLLTIFFAVANLFGLIYLLSFPVWQILIIITLIIFLLVYQFFNEIFDRPLAYLYSLITALVLGQIFWSLTFWPTNYIANAVIVVSSLYITLGIFNHYGHKTLTLRLIKIYFFLGGFTILAVLLSNQWTPR